MQIPAFFTSSEDGSLVVRDGTFEGRFPRLDGAGIPLSDAASSAVDRSDRIPAVVIDCDSLSRRMFTEKILKGMRVRGADIWFMTHIETADDVFDAFNTNADMLMAPYHTVMSDDDMRDIHSVSDSVIPTVFVSHGRVIRRGTAPRFLCETLDSLTDMGFYSICVVDTDDSVPMGDWENALDDCPSLIPFAPSSRISSLGFGRTVVPFRPL